MRRIKTITGIGHLVIVASLTLALIGCSSVPKEDPAAVAAREARAAEEREAKAAAEARAAEEQRKAIEAHNIEMTERIAAYEVGKTTWSQVQQDFGSTYRETLFNPEAGKIGMLSTIRTRRDDLVDPSKSTPLVGRIVIGSWKGTKRPGQVLVGYDRDPGHFDVLVTLDFVENVLVEKY